MSNKTFWLSLSILSTGATGLIYEYILSTVSSYILGNSIEQFSITIAVMLFFMGVAGYFQKKLTDKYLVEKFISVELALSFLGSIVVIGIYLAYIYLE
ncbi:MAG: spermidine synthase, partial [Persephonella sp.]